MSLNVGSRLGHYDVTALIGEGGMGQVYQATDTKLKRQVALKILPEAFSADPERLARFQREAEVLASLNHPNIAAIHGLEEAEGIRALVLELVEGPTLADRIKRGPIPLDEALPIAKQIAEALEAAHEKGIIHRDLKPANIKVREDGTVKVLDFGLAKALDPSPTGDPSESPTLTAMATQMGVIMGTAAYMSPEQARGKTVDKRADIWAFGVVTVEMLTGRKVFEGEDVSTTLSCVLQKEPDWSLLPSTVPPVFRVYLRRCLEKNVKERVHDVADVRLAMSGAFDEAAAATSTAHRAGSGRVGWQRAFPLALGTLVIGSLASGLVVWRMMQPDMPPVTRFRVSPDQGVLLHALGRSPDLAVSPDGTRIVYLSDTVRYGAQSLRLRPLDQLTSTLLVSGGEITNPFFSPDGQSVGFADSGELKRASVQGGSASTICGIRGVLLGATWGSNGTIVFGSGDTTSGLFQVSAVGGAPEQLTIPDMGQDHLWPDLLPGDRAVLFAIVAEPIGDSQIAVLSLDSGEQKVLIQGGLYPRYSPTGHLLYGTGEGDLWAVAFDADRLEVVGDAAPVQEGVLTKTDAGAMNVSLSENGTLIYTPGGTSLGRTLVWVDLEGNEEALPLPPAEYESPRVSPDGRYVAVEVRGVNTDVIIYDLERDISTRLTFETSVDGFPVWSRDGQRVAFASDRDGTLDVYAKAADGTGQVERLTTSESFQAPEVWLADGQLLIATLTGRADSDMGLLDRENRVTDLVKTPFDEGYSALSPDGRWLAYLSNESGEYQIYVRPFPNVDDGKWQISRDGGVGGPVWGPDGRELFFRGNLTTMRRVRVETEPTFVPGRPEVLFPNPYRGGGMGRARPIDLSPDGTRFLMIRETPPNLHFVVVQNWHQELLERVPIP